jgi:excisionase family DNA binding protein
VSQARLQRHPSLQRYASLEEAATYLGCDARTVRRQIAAGRLKGYRFGNKTIRVDLDELDTLLKPIPTASEGGWKA